jgi:O-antigen biosynthesis protein
MNSLFDELRRRLVGLRNSWDYFGLALVHQATFGKGAKARFRRKGRAALAAFLAGDGRITLPMSATPEVSIILVLFNSADLTYGGLRCLQTAIDLPAEVIIVDNASTDETNELLSRVDGARLIRNSENVQFLRGVNQAASTALGKYVLLLNNDTLVEAGPIKIARDVLDEDATAGAVGGKLILPDGTLQEAGSIVWQDGSCACHGRGKDPSDPEFQFRREVDYCSAAFLMLRRDLFEKLGWFDARFAPAYYEETDLCMRIRAAGYRIVYEPRVGIVHFECGSSNPRAAAAQINRNREVFSNLHRRQLEREHLPSDSRFLEARMRSRSPRILVVDDQVPHPELGSCLQTAADMVRDLDAAGCFVTFYPLTAPHLSWEHAYALLPRTVEIMAGCGLEGLPSFVRERAGYYDTVLVREPHMRMLNESFEKVPNFLLSKPLVYDSDPASALREAVFRGATGIASAEERRERRLASRRAWANS